MEQAASMVGPQVLLNEILNRQVHQMHPAELFRLCHNNTVFNNICNEYRVYIWTTYFEQDILPYLYDPNIHLHSFPNYTGDVQVRLHWEAMRETLHTDPKSVTNAPIYELYQQGIERMRNTAWFLSEKLLPYFYVPRLVRPEWTQSLGISEVGPESEGRVRQLITYTTAQIHNLCRLKIRLHVEPTSTSRGSSANKLLSVQKRQVVWYTEFAVYSGNAELLHDIVTAWPMWFYIHMENDRDLLKMTITAIAEVLEKNSVSEQQGKALTHVFAKLFVIPTDINPRGRFSTTYSDEVKELLRPIKVQDEYRDPWHIAAQSIWEDELNTKF